MTKMPNFRQILLLIIFSSTVSSLLWLYLLNNSQLRRIPDATERTTTSGGNANPLHYEQICRGSPLPAVTDNKTQLTISYSFESSSIHNVSERIYPYRAYGRRRRRLDGDRLDAYSYSVVIISIVERRIYCPEQTGSLVSRLFMADEEPPTLNCAFHDSAIRTVARIRCLPEHHDYPFTVAMIQCPALRRFHSVRLENDDMANQWIPIRYPAEEPGFLKNHYQDAIVCVRPLYGTINLFNWLEFLAFYKWQGIGRFIFYHYPAGNDSRDILARIGSITGVHLELLPLPAALLRQVHAGGQLAAINDCVYRYPGSVQLHVDLDEFIMVNNWKERRLVEAIDQWYYALPITHVALYFQNVFHCHEYNQHRSSYYEFKRIANYTVTEEFYRNTADTDPQRLMLVPNSPLCQRTAWPYEIRSKVMLLRPWLVDQMGIHQVWRFWPDGLAIESETLLDDHDLVDQLRLLWLQFWRASSEAVPDSWIALLYRRYVPEEEAVLHHFRWCCHIEQPGRFFFSTFDTVGDEVTRCFWRSANETSWVSLMGQLVRQWYQPG